MAGSEPWPFFPKLSQRPWQEPLSFSSASILAHLAFYWLVCLLFVGYGFPTHLTGEG